MTKTGRKCRILFFALTTRIIMWIDSDEKHSNKRQKSYVEHDCMDHNYKHWKKMHDPFVNH